MAFVTLLPKQNRLGKATVELFGGAKAAGISEVVIKSNIDLAVLQDPDLSFRVNLFTSDDGVIWKHELGFGYEGSKFSPDAPDPLPWIRMRDLSFLIGKFVRIEVESDVRKQIGFDIEVT